MLTHVQRRCLDYVEAQIAASGGVSPTYEEIKGALGMKSKSQVSRTLNRLIERGYIRRMDGRPRALEVVERAHKAPARPTVTYPNAAYYVWDDEAQGLKPWSNGS